MLTDLVQISAVRACISDAALDIPTQQICTETDVTQVSNGSDCTTDDQTRTLVDSVRKLVKYTKHLQFTRFATNARTCGHRDPP